VVLKNRSQGDAGEHFHDFGGRKKRMDNKLKITYLTLVWLLALVAGCGKEEKSTPSTPQADATSSQVKTEPVQMAAPTTSAVATPTNMVVVTRDVAKTTLDAGIKTTDAAVTSVNEVAPITVVTANSATDKVQGSVGQPKATLAGLSQDQMVQGLEDALAKGLQQAIAKLGHDGGFLTNLNVKIPMPEKLQKVETALRAVKQEKLADDFVTTMNHAAEQAVPEAGSVFTDALKQLTIDDAKSILSGPNDAATQYFQKTTQTNLYARFYPIVQKATEKTGVTAAYKSVMEKANVGQSLGSFGSAISDSLLGKDSLNIDAYVTNKAMDGLFKMVAEEEQRIRQNPVARTTDMLQKVFGALKK
jgi:Protein of unknown function (DUF4197)